MSTALIVLLVLWHPYVLCKLLPGRDIRVRFLEVEVVITRM